MAKKYRRKSANKPAKSLPEPNSELSDDADGNSIGDLSSLHRRLRRGLYGDTALGYVSHMHGVAKRCPYPYWSRKRDEYLRQCLLANSWLSSAHYNIVSRLAGLKFKIVPKDFSIEAHVRLAAEYQGVFETTWGDVAERFISDILSQDNGGFLEILDGPDDETRSARLPRVGWGGFRYWDSCRVTRRASAEFPVSIQHTDNEEYRIHTTRLFPMVEMPSGDHRLYGVGYSAVSRAFDFMMDLSNLRDMLDEYYGEGDPEQVWLLKSDIYTAEDLHQLEQDYREGRNNNDQRTGRKLMLNIGPDDDFTIEASKVLPADVSPEMVVILSMKGIAAAYRTTLREIWDKDNSTFGSE